MPCGHPATCKFEEAHQKWTAGDLEGFMALFDEEIVWIVHLDGIAIPYVSSAVGKEDLRWRLQHRLDTFDIAGFDIELLEHGLEYCRSVVRVFYVHKKTGEPLDVKLRFNGWERNDLLVRFEERADAAYVDAFNRFVQYLEHDKQS